MKKKLILLFAVLMVLSTALFAINMISFNTLAETESYSISFESLALGNITSTKKTIESNLIEDVFADVTSGTVEVKEENSEKFIRITSNSDVESKYVALKGHFKSDLTVAPGKYSITMKIRLGNVNAGQEYALKGGKSVSFRFVKSGTSPDVSKSLKPLYDASTEVDANGFKTVTFDLTTTANNTIFWVFEYATAGSYIDVKSITFNSHKIVDGAVLDVPADAIDGENSVVRVYYYNPLENAEKQPSIALYKGTHEDDDNTYRKAITGTKGTENGKNYIEATLVPGIYYAKSYYRNYKFTGDDAIIKYFYVSGDGEPMAIDIRHEPIETRDWAEKSTIISTDELLAHVGTNDLVGFEEFDTPSLTKYKDNTKQFMRNSDLVEYVDNLDANSANLKVYYPFALSNLGNKTPILVFTKNADELPDDFSEAGAKIRALKKEVLMTTGGLHGNEPAGMEGNIAFAKELTGAYGNAVLDFYGAIIIMPSVAVDDAQAYTRNDIVETSINPNRDLMNAVLPSTRNQIATYNNFMPTVYIDCHEDYGRLLLDEKTLSIETGGLDYYDVSVRHANTANSSFYDIDSNLYFQNKDTIQDNIMMNTLDILKNKGLRPSVYYSGNDAPGVSKEFAATNGSASFIIEVMRISTGKARYERAMFGMVEALKTITDQVMSYKGEVATKVYAGRERLASTTKYNPKNIFALDTTSDGFSYKMNYPIYYAWGQVKNATHTQNRAINNKITSYRAMPTAYAFSADNPNANKILDTLTVHGISYTKVKAGSTLKLKEYVGSSSTATLSSEKEVAFTNGAYVVTLNTEKANVIATLFEAGIDCFWGSGYLSEENTLYRSEVDDMHLVIKTMAEGYTPDAPSTPDEKGGCGSIIGTASVVASITLLAGAVMVFKKKD